MDKIWQVAPREFDSLKQQLLQTRALGNEQVREAFLHPDLEQLVSPWDWPDMDKAVERIGRAIEDKEPMVVWGDFDADGVTSTAIMWEILHALGGNVMPYIPVRDGEGHGFSEAGLARIAADGTTLIITVDHGVTAFEGIAKAKELGMEVIVTDHHEPREGGSMNPKKESKSASYIFPDCVAVVHPFRLQQPQMLAGCGVAYFVAYAVWLSSKRPVPSFKLQDLLEVDTVEARREFAEGRIELAAIGTIADLMPLTGTNRVLAALGLEELAKTQRVGLQRLFELAGIKPEQGLSVYEVGFLIGPRLNAPGRLADALESLRLLCTRDADRARQLATTLNDLNEERQYLLARVSREAQQMAAERNRRQAFVLANPDWPAGVCGLAAGKVVEQMYRPTVVMEDQGEYSRGSARSIRGFDITAALTSIADLLVSFGGHAMAAGFVAKTELLPEIESRLSTLVEAQLSEDQLQPRLMIDAEVELSEMDDDLYQFIRQLEPCGMGNPQPVFVARGVEVVGCKAMGKEAKHLKLILGSQPSIVGGAENRERRIKNSADLEAVAFGFGARGEELMGQRIDVAFNLDENVWNGKRSLQLKVRDMRALPQ